MYWYFLSGGRRWSSVLWIKVWISSRLKEGGGGQGALPGVRVAGSSAGKLAGSGGSGSGGGLGGSVSSGSKQSAFGLLHLAFDLRTFGDHQACFLAGHLQDLQLFGRAFFSSSGLVTIGVGHLT